MSDETLQCTDAVQMVTVFKLDNGRERAFLSYKFPNGMTLIDMRLYPVNGPTTEKAKVFDPVRLEAMGVPGWAIGSAMVSTPQGFAACKEKP